MLQILDKYRFFLTLPTGEVEVFPDNSELTWIDELNEDFGFWRKILDTELVFTNNAHLTYYELDQLDKDWGVCHKVLVRVQRRTGAATWADCWNGYLPFRKGKNSSSRTTYYIKPRVEDVYSCFLRSYEKKHNLLDVIERTTVKTIEGTINCTEYITIAGGTGQAGTTFNLTTEYAQQQAAAYAAANLGANWTMTEFFYAVNGGTGSSYGWALTVKYCREEMTTTPTNPEVWVLEGSTYSRPVPIKVAADFTKPRPFTGLSLYGVYEIIDYEADNAITLADALDYLFDQNCSEEIVSNFFNVNATGATPENDEYDQAAVDFQKVVLFQASDIITPDEDNNATILNGSLKMLIGSLMQKFPLRFYYDTGIGKFRLEHESFVTQTMMLDLTQNIEDFQDALSGNREFEYESSDFPVREVWQDKFAVNEDFIDASIEYDTSCASDRDSDREKKYQSEDIIFDFSGLFGNEELIEDKDIRTSIVMVGLDAGNVVQSGIGVLSGEVLQNNVFASSRIIERYWLRSRPLLFGKINDKDIAFVSTKPIRKQNELQITIDSGDYWATFNPQDGVRTQYGWGENVEEVIYQEPTRQMTLTPHFRIKPR